MYGLHVNIILYKELELFWILVLMEYWVPNSAGWLYGRCCRSMDEAVLSSPGQELEISRESWQADKSSYNLKGEQEFLANMRWEHCIILKIIQDHSFWNWVMPPSLLELQATYSMLLQFPHMQKGLVYFARTFSVMPFVRIS